jgi:hypothetical protein
MVGITKPVGFGVMLYMHLKCHHDWWPKATKTKGDYKWDYEE